MHRFTAEVYGTARPGPRLCHRCGMTDPATETGPEERPRVLLVDDDILIGHAIKRALEPPYDVVAVDSAAAALDKLRAGERFALILSDLRMPEMDGMAFEAEVRQIDPALADRMGFLTGGAITDAMHSFVQIRLDRVVNKPFSLETLESLVEELAKTERG